MTLVVPSYEKEITIVLIFYLNGIGHKYQPNIFFEGAGGTIFPSFIYLLASKECIPKKSLKRLSVLNSVRLNLGMFVFVVTLEEIDLYSLESFI